jgi:asparagine synthase (glutamine-hydrolysing)
MNAIAGLLHREGQPASDHDLIAMASVLAHRAPAGFQIYRDGAAGLAGDIHSERRHGRMPLLLVADARIDNRDELAGWLGVAASSFAGDGELILLAYRKWGARCIEKFSGDFAFAIWDEAERTLFCARDHMGVKPFYYHSSGTLFAFASEIKGLLQLPGISAEVNELRIAEYLLPVLDDTEATFYRGICRLPAAHAMLVSGNRVTIWRYWSLNPEARVTFGSDNDYVAAFRELFSEAVRCRLRGPETVGAMLSGGLDSSSIAAEARNRIVREGGGGIMTFSALFDDVPECNERSYITEVLRAGGYVPHFLHADRESPLADVERMLRSQDEPYFAPNLFIHDGLFGIAREQGIGAMLDGFDGDTVVSHGVAFLTDLARSGQWGQLWQEVQGLSRNFGLSPARLLWKRGIKPLAPDLFRRLRGRREIPLTLSRLISPDLAARTGLVERLRDTMAERSRPSGNAAEDHFRRIMSGLIPLTLEVLDHAAAAQGIEPRFPFFDRRLVEFCLALPSEQKISAGWTRAILRRSMTGTLPDRIAWRPGKITPAASFVRGMRGFQTDLLRDLLFGDSALTGEYIDRAAVEGMYARMIAHNSVGDAISLWRVATVSAWIRGLRDNSAHSVASLATAA